MCLFLTVAMSTGSPAIEACNKGSKPLANRRYSLAPLMSPLFFAANAASLNTFCRIFKSACCLSARVNVPLFPDGGVVLVGGVAEDGGDGARLLGGGGGGFGSETSTDSGGGGSVGVGGAEEAPATGIGPKPEEK